MSEKARENFIRIEESRVNRAITAISNVGNLKSGTKFYDFNEKDIEKIKEALEAEVEKTVAKLKDVLENGKTKNTFTLREKEEQTS